MRPARGFTLIEIAVVMAIIALVAAAMFMSANSLFGRSGMTTLLANIHDLATASREFKTRYSYFPGDLPNAGTYITAGGVIGACIYAAGGTKGDGVVNAEDESRCALEHLVKAGMLRGIAYDTVDNRYVIVLNTWGTNTRVSLWFDSTANVNAVRVTDLPCEVALEIDRKLDSGTSGNTPFKEGSVTARNASNTAIDGCTPGAANDPVPTLLIRY